MDTGTPDPTHVEAAAFFDAFVQAFATFDGAQVARRYFAPYLARHGDGSLDCFSDPTQIAAYFQRILDAYHERGCRSCAYESLDVSGMGRDCLLATVTWSLLQGNGSLVARWRESYSLARTPDGLKIFASVDHA